MKLYDLYTLDGTFVDTLTRKEAVERFNLSGWDFKSKIDYREPINGEYYLDDSEDDITVRKHEDKGMLIQFAVKVAEATKQGYSECRVGIDTVNLSVPGSKTRRGRVGKEVANTLDTSCNQGIFVKVSDELIVYAVWYEKYQCYIAIRKLTPKECFRLQGWSDNYFEKAQFVNSDSQLYKQAGNGVTVTVIETIARKMNVNLN